MLFGALRRGSFSEGGISRIWKSIVKRITHAKQRPLKIMTNHISVLSKEVIEGLTPKHGDTFVDGTFGFGGHSRLIGEHIGETGRIIGIDKDSEILDLNSQDPFLGRKNVAIIRDDFRNLDKIIEKLGIKKIDKILLDLGVSSYHFDKTNRGFTFSGSQTLDMRLDQREQVKARDLVNGLSEKELADMFYKLADETRSRQIAKAIVEARRKQKIETTDQLSEVISAAIRSNSRKINPATKVFQALRIAVNDELSAIEEVLPKAIDCLNKGGRIAVISFHSGEDRIVKNIFKKYSGESIISLVNKKPITASAEEIRENPRSRSAKLRIAEKI